MDFNNELRSSELNYDFFDPYNVIRFIMSFLSRSTQESGFQTKKKKKDSKEKFSDKKEEKRLERKVFRQKRRKKTINKSQKVKLK